MAETRKSIIEEAFMEAESIEQAFKVNSKEILAHTMGSEIEQMVKESLEGSNGLNEDEDEEEEGLGLDIDDVDSDEASSEAGDDIDLELGDMGDMELDSMEDDDDQGVVDLTGENDETIVNVFKKMSPEDEIEVVQVDGGVEIKDKGTGAEYRVEFGDSATDTYDFENEKDDEDENQYELELDDEDDEEGEGEEGEVEYQIELDDEDDEDDEDVSESMSRTKSNIRRNNLKPMNLRNENRGVRKPIITESKTPQFSTIITENRVLKNKLNSVKSENQTLKEDYNKMVDALKEFREKLNEVAVFNSNLTYTVRLFTEHTTTKNEKVDIIRRFDEAKTLKESKNIYKSLMKEVSKIKTPIKESIDDKLNETKSSGSATQITESKVYVNPELEKMKKLWEYSFKK